VKRRAAPVASLAPPHVHADSDHLHHQHHLQREIEPDGVWLTAAFVNHRSALKRYARRLGADSSLAEDLASETFLRAWRHTRTTRLRPDNTEAYLLRIERNLYFDHCLREARLQKVLGKLEQTADVAETGPDTAGRMSIAAALRELPAKMRDVLVCRYYLDLSMSETAEVLGLTSAGSAAVTAHRARDALRRRLVPEASQVAVGQACAAKSR
jgi:RNA polymerase sigma-70 factor (ECF subfamily)